MASTISAGTTSSTALNMSADTSGALSLLTNNGSTTALALTSAGAATFASTLATSSRGISTASVPAGSVIQVVNATYGTETSSTTNTQIATGLTASITPQFSTSKILVIANLNGVSHTTNNTSVQSYLRRNTSNLYLMSLIAAANDANSGNNTTDVGSVSITYLDSPATTSSTSYNCTFASQQGNATAYVQRYGATSSITLMEIAG